MRRGLGLACAFAAVATAGAWTAPARAGERKAETTATGSADGPAPGQEAQGPIGEPERQAAKSHFVAGSDFFAAGKYREAIAEFQKAYEIVGSPEILYNIGRCFEELGERERAVQHYETYLRLNAAGEDADDVRTRIEALRAEETVSEPDAAAEDGSRTAGGPGPAWTARTRIGAGLGADQPLTGDAPSTNLAVSVLVHYPVGDWLYVCAAAGFGHYFNERKTYDPETAWSLAVGASAVFGMTEDLALVVHLVVDPAWISFQNHDGLTWLSFRGGAGTAWAIDEAWRVIAEISAASGPVFNPAAKKGDHFGSPDAETEIGALIGAEYVLP